MKSRLFPSGRVALVVNSLLFTPPALAGCAPACKPAPLRRRAACRSHSRLRSCQTKKSIDFICHVMTRDWYYAVDSSCTGNRDKVISTQLFCDAEQAIQDFEKYKHHDYAHSVIAVGCHVRIPSAVVLGPNRYSTACIITSLNSPATILW